MPAVNIERVDFKTRERIGTFVPVETDPSEEHSELGSREDILIDFSTSRDGIVEICIGRSQVCFYLRSSEVSAREIWHIFYKRDRNDALETPMSWAFVGTPSAPMDVASFFKTVAFSDKPEEMSGLKRVVLRQWIRCKNKRVHRV